MANQSCDFYKNLVNSLRNTKMAPFKPSLPLNQSETTMKIFGKSDKWMVMMTIAGMMLLTGCGKSAHEGEGTSGESKDAKAVLTQQVASPVKSESAENESDGEDDTVYEGLLATTSDWKKTPITVSPKGSKANIEDFAQAFCSQYSRFEPNKKMLKYLADPKSYNKEKEIYDVKSSVPNGYICSVLWTEIDRYTKMCYWNRKNGHQLVGIFMVNGSENTNAEAVFMFYDYDQKTNIMTPDMNVCKVVEKVAIDKNFEEYALVLPEQGKDIVVNLYSDNGDDGYNMTEKTLKWTGDSFAPVGK